MVFAVVLCGGFALLWNNPCTYTVGDAGYGRRRLVAALASEAPNSKHQSSSDEYGPKKSTMIFQDGMANEEAAMNNFFNMREEWSSTFRFLAGESLPKDISALLLLNRLGLASDDTKEPWQLYDRVPQDANDRAVLEGFLNSMHQALLDIPVTDSYVGNGDPLDNENDITFLEEGRRMLAVNRYHVLRDNSGGSVESMDTLFKYCWSELREMINSGQTHTGSIILLPQYDRSDLKSFLEMNVARPLHWLGIGSFFEVSNLEFGPPAIRLLYRLDDMPVLDSE